MCGNICNKFASRLVSLFETFYKLQDGFTSQMLIVLSKISFLSKMLSKFEKVA